MTALLEVHGLTVTYGGVTAVRGATFDVPAGRMVGLIGPNGAGKTSLVDALTGYTRPSGGTVLFKGQDITSLAPHRRARVGLARTFQSIELFDDLTIEENLAVASQHVGLLFSLRELVSRARPVDRDAVDLALSICNLEAVARRYPAELSHGQRKLVGVARALAQRPSLVLLDEPAAGLDTDESFELGTRLRAMPAYGTSVLLIDHDMSLVLTVCDEVMVLDFGALIASAAPAQIRRDPRVIAAYLGSRGDGDDD